MNDERDLRIAELKGKLESAQSDCARFVAELEKAEADRKALLLLLGAEWAPPESSLTCDDVVICATCNKLVLFRDSWSPGDEALCSECDTEVTGRKHGPTLPVTFEALQKEIEKVLNQTAEVFTKPNVQ